MKAILFGGAALAALVAIPALAQTPAPAPVAPAAPHVMIMHHDGGKVRTRAEVANKVREHFARLDTNKDGFVTKPEADAARQKMVGEMRERFAHRMAEGGVPAVPPVPGVPPVANRKEMFDRLDTNKDGSISRQEFEAAPPRIERRRIVMRDGKGGKPGAMRMRMHGMGGFGGRMFEMADANKDGRVSLQEATNAALKHFDMADANRDGQLTPEERRQMHQKMRAERRPG